MLAKLCTFRAAHFLLKVGELSRRVRSWPFDTLIGAFCPTFRALSDAPISVANGHDLTLLPRSPTFEQKACSPESAQFGKHDTQCRVISFGRLRLVFFSRFLHLFVHAHILRSPRSTGGRFYWWKARRRARSWPCGTLYSAFCSTSRAEHAPLPRICYYKGKSPSTSSGKTSYN